MLQNKGSNFVWKTIHSLLNNSTRTIETNKSNKKETCVSMFRLIPAIVLTELKLWQAIFFYQKHCNIKAFDNPELQTLHFIVLANA